MKLSVKVQKEKHSNYIRMIKYALGVTNASSPVACGIKKIKKDHPAGRHERLMQIPC